MLHRYISVETAAKKDATAAAPSRTRSPASARTSCANCACVTVGAVASLTRPLFTPLESCSAASVRVRVKIMGLIIIRTV
jgi:hypothetical protein